MNTAIVIDTQEGIQMFHLLQLKYAMKMELQGLRHSSGRSVCAHVKRLYGYKGNKQAVFDQYCKYLESLR